MPLQNRTKAYKEDKDIQDNSETHYKITETKAGRKRTKQ